MHRVQRLETTPCSSPFPALPEFMDDLPSDAGRVDDYSRWRRGVNTIRRVGGAQ